jgi:hypothetical protein
MQGARVLTPFATGKRELWLQSRHDDIYIRTHGGGAANRSCAVFAGDGQQGLFGRDRQGLLAICSTGSDGLLRVEYNYQGYFGSWTTLTTNQSSTHINTIWFFSSSLIYVAGTAAGGGRIWKWNGTSWSIVVSTAGGSGFITLHAFSQTEILSNENQAYFLYEFNGTSWVQRSLPNGNDRAHDLWGVVESDGQKWWYVVGNTATGAVVWRKRPGDTSFSQYGPVLSGKTPTHIHPFGDGSLVIAAGIEIWYLASSSSSWVLKDTATGYTGIRSLHGTVNAGGADMLPPVLQNQNPASGSTTSSSETVVLEVIDTGSGLDTSSVVLSVAPDGGSKTAVWSSETEQNGASVSTSVVTDGLRYTITLPEGLQASSTMVVYVVAYDNNANLLDTLYPFDIEYVAPLTEFRAQLTVENIAVVQTPKLTRRLNQFDEHGSIVGLQRNRGEKNWSYRRRIWDTFVHRANSSYRGLVHGMTRELGLSLFDAMCVNPKVDESGAFLAPDPYILFQGPYLYLYSDYANSLLDWQIDRYEAGANYEHLGRLVDLVNTTAFFEAELRAPANSYTRSMTILNQSNREAIATELLPPSTKLKLEHPYIVANTLFFSNLTVFKTLVGSVSAVTSAGDYHVDCVTGVVTTHSVPHHRDVARYHYVKYPFCATASPVILHDINDEDFRVKMFSQILQDDGSYTHGLPTELGVDIINELISLYPLYWGV